MQGLLEKVRLVEQQQAEVKRLEDLPTQTLEEVRKNFNIQDSLDEISNVIRGSLLAIPILLSYPPRAGQISGYAAAPRPARSPARSADRPMARRLIVPADQSRPADQSQFCP